MKQNSKSIVNSKYVNRKLLYSEFFVKHLESLELVDLHVDEVLYAGSLEVVRAGRSTGNDEDRSTTVEILVCRDGIISTVVLLSSSLPVLLPALTTSRLPA